MRQIEEDMIAAINANEKWHKDNTEVVQTIDSARVYLYGNHIATVDTLTGEVLVNKQTLAYYPTNTTKSRLRALGCNVYTRAGVTYLDDEPI